MRADRVAWQSDESRAVILTRHYRILGSYGVATTKLFRRLANGHLDLTCPVWTNLLLCATEQDAERQHTSVWKALQQDTLPPAVMGVLLPRDACPSPLSALSYLSTTRPRPN